MPTRPRVYNDCVGRGAEWRVRVTVLDSFNGGEIAPPCHVKLGGGNDARIARDIRLQDADELGSLALFKTTLPRGWSPSVISVYLDDCTRRPKKRDAKQNLKDGFQLHSQPSPSNRDIVLQSWSDDVPDIRRRELQIPSPQFRWHRFTRGAPKQPDWSCYCIISRRHEASR